MLSLSPKIDFNQKDNSSKNIKDYVILINLGTPADTRLFTIQKYLFEFLFDPCVISMPFFLRLLLVGGIIVPFRSLNTRRSYQQIFTSEGSPLMVISRKVEKELQRLYRLENSSKEVILAMRYGEPSMEKAFKRLQDNLRQGYQVRVTFVPLYPQAALSTTGTVVRKIEKLAGKKRFSGLKYKIAPPFYRDEDYLDILAAGIRPYLKRDHDYILFSYHGIPEKHLNQFDPGNHCLSCDNCCEIKNSVAEISQRHCYRHQVYETTTLLAEKLGLMKENYITSFQSRLGRDPWLTPYTDQTIIELAKKGVKKLLVVCPAFVCDNLETLFEIEIENKELFCSHGGESLILIPCLNDRKDWIRYLKGYAEKYFP